MQAPDPLVDAVRRALEKDRRTRVIDLHVWSVGPGIYAAAATLVAPRDRLALEYRRRIPAELGIVHVQIEIHPDGARG